jgi:hypothetical protein
MANYAEGRIGKLGMAGYPGYIFLQKIRYGYGQQRFAEKRAILHNWYSALRAYLREYYHVRAAEGLYKNEKEEYALTIAPLINAVAEKIEASRKRYSVNFENPDTRDPLEAEYEILLEGILEDLDEITAISGIIDKARIDDDSSTLVAG